MNRSPKNVHGDREGVFQISHPKCRGIKTPLDVWTQSKELDPL
jgi:hypothetical protein